MKWEEVLSAGCADRIEQRQGWIEIERLKQRCLGYQGSRDYAIDMLAAALSVNADKMFAIEYYAKKAAGEIKQLRELAAAVKKYAKCKSKAEGLPTDWTVAEAKWQEVVQQVTQLAAEPTETRP